MLRKVAVLGFIKSAFQVINFWPDMNASAKSIAFAILQRRKVGQRGQGKIHLGHCTRHAVMLELHDEIGSKIRWINKLEQGALGISIGDDGPGSDLLAADKQYA